MAININVLLPAEFRLDELIDPAFDMHLSLVAAHARRALHHFGNC